MRECRNPWRGEDDHFRRAPHERPPFGHNSNDPERRRIPPGFEYAPPPPGINPYRRRLRHNSNALCAGLTLCFSIGTIAIWLLHRLIFLFPRFGLFMQNLSPVGQGLFSMSINTLALLLPALLAAVLLNMPFRIAFPMRRTSARLTVPGVFCCLGMSVIGVGIAVLLTSLLARTAGVGASMPDFSAPYGGVEIVMFLIAISVVPAVFEELLCRGVVMQSLRRFGDDFALVTSSLLFAMLHRNLLQGPNAFVTGMLLGYFTLRAGSLIPAIVMHFFNNFIFGLFSVAVMHLPAQYGEALNLLFLPVFLGLGAVGIILMSVLNGGFIPVHRKSIGLSTGEKYGLFFTAPLAIVFILATIYQARHFFEFI